MGWVLLATAENTVHFNPELETPGVPPAATQVCLWCFLFRISNVLPLFLMFLNKQKNEQKNTRYIIVGLGTLFRAVVVLNGGKQQWPSGFFCAV